MINMDTMKIKATKVEITRRKEDDLPGYKNDHKHYKKSYKKSDGGFNQKMDQEDLKTYTAAFELWATCKQMSIKKEETIQITEERLEPQLLMANIEESQIWKEGEIHSTSDP
ncbi:hypothetical protein Tco_1264972 [Tanacetum coccineum]